MRIKESHRVLCVGPALPMTSDCISKSFDFPRMWGRWIAFAFRPQLRSTSPSVFRNLASMLAPSALLDIDIDGLS